MGGMEMEKASNMKKGLILVVMCCITVLLTGCWDKKELEDQAFVMVIGLDKNKDQKNIQVTFQIANPQVGSTEKSQSDREPASEIVTIQSPSFTVAKQLVNTTVTRNITLSHAKAIVIGSELAKSDQLIRVVETLLRDYEIRQDILLITSEEKASTFIRSNHPAFETRPHKYYDLMMNRWKDNGFVPLSTLQKYVRQTQQDAGAFLSIYGTTQREKHHLQGHEDDQKPGRMALKGVNNTQIIGSAVFSNGNMIGSLTGEETRICLLLRRDTNIQQITTSYPDPFNKKGTLGVRVTEEKKPKINVKITKPGQTIDVYVPLKMEIVSMTGESDYPTNRQKRKQLEMYIEHILEKETTKLVHRSQKNYKIDLFNFYSEGRKKFATIPQYEQYNWTKRYPYSTVRVRYDVTFHKYGKQIKSPNIRNIKD